MGDVNVFGVAVTEDDDDPDGYHTLRARLGPLLGASALGMSVYEIRPGQSICPYHYEIGYEEWLIVFTGEPTLRTPSDERVLRPWDCVFFPDGEAGAHKVTNKTDENLRVGILSNEGDPGATVYPDSEKVGIWPPGHLFRRVDAVGYWEGEI